MQIVRQYLTNRSTIIDVSQLATEQTSEYGPWPSPRSGVNMKERTEGFIIASMLALSTLIVAALVIYSL
jgi:hypothetical protein